MRKAIVTYDLKAWRERMGWCQAQACIMLGFSRTTWWKMEKMGIVPECLPWACYGLEIHEQQRKAS